MGGAVAYVVSLIHYESAAMLDEFEQMWPDCTAYIDGEDESKSSWCRFINHASEESVMCNCHLRTDGLAGLAWIEAKRDIAPEEELSFDYGPRYAQRLTLLAS